MARGESLATARTTHRLQSQRMPTNQFTSETHCVASSLDTRSQWLIKLCRSAYRWSTLAPLTGLTAALCILLAVVPALSTVLQFDRTAILGGEVWRLATGHWTHWNY